MRPCTVPDRPPAGSPEVVTSVVWADEADGPWHAGGTVAGGRLHLCAPAPGGIAAVPLHQRPVRDVVIDVALTVEVGAPVDMLGVYLRQGGPDRYLACGFAPTGLVGIVAVDGADRRVLVGGSVAPDLPFNEGPGRTNRCTVVACGPNVTMLLNHSVVLGVMVDPRYKEGRAGVIVADGGADARAAAAVSWGEIRALLADQGAG